MKGRTSLKKILATSDALVAYMAITARAANFAVDA